MNSNGLLKKHWLYVGLHFLIDAGLFFSVCILSAHAVFFDEAWAAISVHSLSFIFTSILFASSLYIAGLYTSHTLNRSVSRRFFALMCCVLGASLVLVGITYASTARALGRGYILWATCGVSVVGIIHHALLLYSLKTAKERVAYIITGPFDESEMHVFYDIGLDHLNFAGVITANGYQPSGKMPILGDVDKIADLVERERIDRILVTGKALNNAALCSKFCKLRYSGVTVMPLVTLCEEVDQYVPLELISPEWLLNASGEPHLLYIRKVKRLFDIVVSTLGLVAALPLMALAALSVKVTSRGPVLYRQIRSGRFGKTFSMIKFRTMCVDAEKDGAQWAQGGANGSRDPRVTLLGGFMRKFRIDEIPQLWNVLKGEMSFVGPRPERPEMIAALARQVPHYEERMMVQPGITGWAQVSYPYGASMLDARRKLEYDLYYLKHMGLFLDVFILLDTVRTILFGGAQSRERQLKSDAMERMGQIQGRESAAAVKAAHAHELELGSA